MMIISIFLLFRKDRIHNHFITNTVSMQAILYFHIKAGDFSVKNRKYPMKTNVPIDYEDFRC